MQRVLGGIVVHVPAFQKVGLKGEFAGIFDQRLKRLTLRVGDLRPVGRARILGILHPHGDLEHAAFLGFLRQGFGRRCQPEHAVGHGCRGAEHARESQKFTAVHVTGFGLFRHLDDMVWNTIPITLVEGHNTNSHFFGFLPFKFRIQSAMSKRTGCGTH